MPALPLQKQMRAAQKKLKREQLGADQASFRVWVSLCTLGLVRFPAVLMKTQWQCFWEVQKGVKVLVVLSKMPNPNISPSIKK